MKRPAQVTSGLLAGAMAGILSVASVAPLQVVAADGASDGKVDCYGINKCKGQGDCGGKGNSCAGTNSCKRQGFLTIDKETCLKIEGGTLKAVPVSGGKKKSKT